MNRWFPCFVVVFTCSCSATRHLPKEVETLRWKGTTNAVYCSVARATPESSTRFGWRFYCTHLDFVVPGETLGFLRVDRTFSYRTRDFCGLQITTSSGDSEALVLSYRESLGSSTHMAGIMRTEKAPIKKYDDVLQVTTQDVVHIEISDMFMPVNIRLSLECMEK